MTKRWQLVISVLLIWAALACIAGVLVSARLAARRPRGGVARNYDELRNLEAMALYCESLPRDGRNFRYYATVFPPYANVSFEISEEGFRKWASLQGWEVSEIARDGEHETDDFLFETTDGEMISIAREDGLVYSKSVFSEGRLESSTDILYDRSSGTAYYRYTH